MQVSNSNHNNNSSHNHPAATGRTAAYENPSPINSATHTPANNSPTSPRLTNNQLQQVQAQSRQLRPPKSPLYVPAALRLTERQAKPAPITPPRSIHDSVDNLNGDNNDPLPLSRESTFDSTQSGVGKMAEDEWLKGQNLGEITGSPTREHWKADSASPTCDSPVCKSFFGLFVRRHHCRHCGHVFCWSHTPHIVPLDQNARFHPDGAPSRACDMCWSAYRRWEHARTDRLNEIQNNMLVQIEGNNRRGGGGYSTRRIDMDRGSDIDSAPQSPSIDPQGGLVASSVPRDWSWSTF